MSAAEREQNLAEGRFTDARWDLSHRSGEDPPRDSWKAVPWRTILAAIAMVGIAFIGLFLIYSTARIITWVVVAGFFAIVLNPPVRYLERRMRRGMAVAVVFFSALLTVVALLTLFILPVSRQLPAAVSDLPGTIAAAAKGQGPVGNLVTRLHLEKLVADNQQKIQDGIKSLSGASVRILSSVFNTVLSLITILVLTFLFLTQSHAIGRTVIQLIPERRRDSARAIGFDAASAISGYMLGNLLISLIAGSTAFAGLLIFGVPNAALLALWVAFADLIPLVGATLGAAAAVVAAFLHSTTAGIVILVFFIIYQQFENSVLQVSVMSRTVRVSPLVILLSVLVGIELFGFVGALLAIPAAGAIQVVAKAAWAERPEHHRLIVPIASSDDPVAK